MLITLDSTGPAEALRVGVVMYWRAVLRSPMFGRTRQLLSQRLPAAALQVIAARGLSHRHAHCQTAN